jgi:hypothetical protein
LPFAMTPAALLAPMIENPSMRAFGRSHAVET